MRAEATMPPDYATNVSLTPLVGVQFAEELGYPGDGLFDVFQGSRPLITIMNEETGEVVESAELDIETPSTELFDRGLLTYTATLQPNTLYRATLDQDGYQYEWSFTTGDGEVEPFAQALELEMNLDAYFSDEPQYSCCPIEFPGECPRCFMIGYEPLPTINAGFDLLPHPVGPAAFVYTLQRRVNTSGAMWGDVVTGAFDQNSGSLKLEDHGLVNEDLCFRVIARSVIEPFLEYESNEECRNGADHFSDPPDGEPYNTSEVMCGDGTGTEDPDPDMPDENGNDADGDGTEDDPRQDGWELDEDGSGKPTDSGCGCASTGAEKVPGSLLLIALVLGLRRRR